MRIPFEGVPRMLDFRFGKKWVLLVCTGAGFFLLLGASNIVAPMGVAKSELVLSDYSPDGVEITHDNSQFYLDRCVVNGELHLKNTAPYSIKVDYHETWPGALPWSPPVAGEHQSIVIEANNEKPLGPIHYNRFLQPLNGYLIEHSQFSPVEHPEVPPRNNGNGDGDNENNGGNHAPQPVWTSFGKGGTLTMTLGGCTDFDSSPFSRERTVSVSISGGSNLRLGVKESKGAFHRDRWRIYANDNLYDGSSNRIWKNQGGHYYFTVESGDAAGAVVTLTLDD